MQHTDWKLAARAATRGALCALGPSLILFGWYAAQNSHLPLPWAQIGVMSALVGAFTGAAFGGIVTLLVARFDRARGCVRLVANPITAGILGGAVASILAGVFAVAVFGSYRGPYVGTIEATALLITACGSLGTLLTVDALRGTRVIALGDLVPAAGIQLVSALIIGVVTAGIAILLAPSLISTGIFWTARLLVSAHGPLWVGCALGVTVGAIFGAHLGLSILLGRRAR